MDTHTIKKLEEAILARYAIQVAQETDPKDDPDHEQYTTEELISFAIEEANENDELSFLCEVAYYQCKDEECTDPNTKKRSTITRNAETLQEAGDPYCPACGGDMEGITAKAYQELNTQ